MLPDRALDADIASTEQDHISNNAPVDVYSRYAPGVFPLGFSMTLFEGTGVLSLVWVMPGQGCLL
jgi:hypothetical protein